MSHTKVLALLFSVIVVTACGDQSDNGGNPGGVEGAFSSQATWESGCLISDQFGLTMAVRYEIEGEAFRRVGQYHSDGTCSELTVETVEEGSTFRVPATDGSPTGTIDFTFSRIDITPKSEFGILALRSVARCGREDWQINQTRNVTGVSGANCWHQTPRTVRDIYSVSGNDLIFGIGSEKEKSGSASRPTAFDQMMVWKIR